MPSPPRFANDRAVTDEIHSLRVDFDAMKSQLDAGAIRFQRIESKVDEGNAATKDLVDAWRTATGVVRFMKFLAGFATAMAALWALVKLIWDKS